MSETLAAEVGQRSPSQIDEVATGAVTLSLESISSGGSVRRASMLYPES